MLSSISIDTINSLTISELDVLRFIQNNRKLVLDLSVKRLAETTFVSTATVMRLCKKLGFSGFNELKYHIKEELNQMEKANRDATFADTVYQNVKAIEETAAMLDEKKVMKIVDLMMKPTNIHFFGKGLTATVLEYASKQLLTYNRANSIYTDTHIAYLVAESPRTSPFPQRDLITEAMKRRGRIFGPFSRIFFGGREMKAYFIMLLSLLIILVGCAGPENPEEPDDGRDEPSAPVDEPADPGDSPVSGDDNYVVYINLDGFAKYYYDEAVKRGGAKTLRGLIGEGVMFENLYNLPPSITNPNQAMIISGATSAKTQNVYRYFDKKTGTVVQQSRDNEAETLYDKAVQLGITVTSVRHFPAESVLSPTDSRRLYVTEGTGVVADAEVRFDQAIKIVKGEAFQNGSKTMRLAEVPRFLSIYCDDLDALGHNEVDNYGYKKANTEAGRMENVLDCLEKIDGKLAELIQAYKDRGIYEKTTFFLTTDHGMTPFGADSLTSALFSKYSRSKWPDLRDKLKSINSKFVFEYLGPGEKPSNSTTVVGVGTGLQMQLTFLNPITQAELENIKKELLKEDYIGEVYTREELLQEGYWSGANVDLLVVPAEKYHFHGRTNPSNLYYARGQHDSRLDSSSHIYGIIWGYKVKKLGVLETKTLAPQFGVAMAELLGFTLRDANVDRLDIFTKD